MIYVVLACSTLVVAFTKMSDLSLITSDVRKRCNSTQKQFALHFSDGTYDVVRGSDQYGFSLVVCSHLYRLVQWLISHGATVSLLDEHKWTPLTSAISGSHFGLALQLLKVFGKRYLILTF